MKKVIISMFAAFVAGAIFAAPAAQTKSNFARPPVAALKALKATLGKPFNSGWVFIDGKYVPPPYKVERYGTVIRINGQQVTREVIAWDEFIKTQPGVKATKIEPSGAAGSDEAPAAEPEPEPEPEEDADDAWENSLDDLFDDEPAAKKTSTKKAGSGYKIKPKKPEAKIVYSFDGEFVPNEKSKALLQRINNYRTKIDSHLRSGGLCCFSARYSGVTVDSGAAKAVMAKLPDFMKQATSAAGLAQAVRGAGFVYFPNPFFKDLFANRVDYIKLLERNRKERSNVSW